MGDTTASKLRWTLEQPEEAVTAGRRAFVAIIWVSVAIAVGAHASEAQTTLSLVAAVAIAGSLMVWLHLVFRIQDGDATTGRTIVMVSGAIVAFVAWVAIDPAYLIVLFGLYTLIFAWTHEDHLAIGLSFAVTLCWVGAWLYHDLPTGAIATPFFVWATLVAMQQAQSRIATQSTERRDLLSEIEQTRAELADEQRARGALEERQRVAAEIHDTLAQGFTSIVLLSEATSARFATLPPEDIIQSLALVEHTARENLTAARRLVEGQGPAELESSSLDDALVAAAARFEARTGAECEVVSASSLPPLRPEVEQALLRVTQEALANAAKYAAAPRVEVRVSVSDVDVQLRVRDFGKGFDPEAAPTEVSGLSGGSGRELMRRRMSVVGGSLEVTSQVGDGTTVTAVAPRQQLQ